MQKLLIGLLGISMLFLSACNSASSPSNATGNQSQKPSAATEQPPEPTPTPSTSLLSIGDSATLGDWEISVTDFYYTDKIDMTSYTYYHPDEGNQYAVVAVQVANKGKDASTFLPTYSLSNDVRAKVYYAGEYEYSATNLLGVNEDLHDSTMNPLASKEGIIVFSVPDEVVNGEDSLCLTFSANRNEITFSLR